MKQLYVFSPDVTGEEILRKLRAGAEDFACYDKSCAPPPVGEGGSSKGTGRSSKLAGRITEILKERPGATLNPRAGYKDVTTGFVVSERPDLSYEKPLSDLSAGDIDGWLADNRETLAKAGNNVGVWHDRSTGQVWLDVVRVYPATGKGRRDAVASGIKHNQIAIYDLDNDDEITIGGTGKAISAALTAACRSKACAPPPVGTGGSAEQGTGSGEIAIYEVGGAVRDRLMGIESDDVDFAVTADSYDAMKRHLESEGFRIFQESPEFVTIKAQPPEGHPLRERTMSADFVLARRDGPSSDGRRPDYTEPGSLEDDLARRDFTVNAIAEAPDGRLIDPHGGQQDIESKTLRFVGDPMTRVREDGLRALRGFRFMVTKGLTPDPATWDAITSPEAAQMLQSVSKERVSAELTKMLDYDTRSAVRMLGSLPEATLDAIFRDGVRLAPTMKKQRGRSLNASALVAACRSKECAPPPVGTGGSVPTSSGGARGKLAATLSRTRNVTNRPVGRSSYKPGRKKVGDATPLTDPDRFSTEDLRAELRHQRRRNWRTWQTNPEVRDRIVRLTNEISRRGRESRGYRRGMAASLVAACRSKECAPPPVGNGGSLPRGAGGSAKMGLPEMTVVSKRSVPSTIAQSPANMDYKGTFKVPASGTVKKTVGKTVDEQVEYFEQRYGIRLSYADDATSGDFAEERYGALYALDQMAQRYPDTLRDMDVLINRPPGFSYDMALFRWKTPEGDPTRQMTVSVGGSWLLGSNATPNERRRLFAAAVIHETGHSLTFDAVGRDVDVMQGLAWDLQPQSVGDKLIVRGSSLESVSMYATTNIAEDIAESFTAHILGIDPPDEVGRRHVAQHIEAIAASGAARPDAIAYLYAMAGEEDEPTTASALIELACRSKECAPPPVGRGGSTESEGSGRQLKDPSAAVGQRGDIYRNLHHGSDDSPVWSVRSGGRVIGHASQVLIANPMFVVGQKARERVLREKSKNVHAFVRGEVSAVNDDVPDVRDGSWRVAKYDPYKYSTFVDSETEEPVTSASEAVLASSTSVYYRP